MARWSSKLRQMISYNAVVSVVALVATFGWGVTLWSKPRPASQVIHGLWSSFPRRDAPKYGGSEAVIARARGDTLVAGVFTHSGTYSYTFPFDEFAYVTSGSVKVSVVGGERFTLTEGHFVYFPQGTSAHFEAGKNYANIAVFASSKPIRW